MCDELGGEAGAGETIEAVGRLAGYSRVPAPEKEPWRRRWFFAWASLGWLALANLCDVLSSSRFPEGWYESSPYARDFLGNFVWRHALVYDGLWFLLILLVSAIAYLVARRLSEPLGRIFFVALPLYYGYGSFVASIHNLWIRIGWYVEEINGQ